MGSILLALLLAAFPILRFSGHHELEAMLHLGQDSGMGILLALAILKILALSLCLSSGWRGGAIFPLLFAGAAAGGAVIWLLPQTPVTIALISGMAAAMTVGIGKPIVAVLVALFLFGPIAIGPHCVAIFIGWSASNLVTKPVLH
jgi:H+/Cl- antiporter ClcA